MSPIKPTSKSRSIKEPNKKIKPSKTMGNICHCVPATQTNDKQNTEKRGLQEPMNPSTKSESIDQRDNSDEWDISKLTRNNTKVIEIKPDEENQKGSQQKKVNVEDFKFHKV